MARTPRHTSGNLNWRARVCRGGRVRPKAIHHRRLMLESLELRQLLSANPVISEILADNEAGIVDSSGAHTDWLEICNPNSQQAVDLTGWKLQYGSGTFWTFPAVSLGPGEFRVIFCTSGNSQTDPNGELHANFNLSKDGKYLALLDNNNNVVQSFSPTYPALGADTSYGIGEQVTETKLVAAGATARYYVPTNGNLGSTWTQPGYSDSAWASGPTGLGFVSLVPGFAVTNYKASLGSIATVAQAQSVIDNPSNQSWTSSETAPVINYLNTGGSGEFPNDRPFPGMPIGTDYDCFVTKVTGRVHIPTAGNWTFGVNSDDGFSCTINGQTFAYDGLRAPGDSFGTINFAAAGDYDLSLVFFENGGGSGLEIYASSGQKASFDSTFRLVGDTANGGLSVQSTPVGGAGNSSAFANAVKTNVQAAMQTANNTSLYTRITFDASNLASLQSLTLKMQYDDGYVAYLNGVEVARRNAPTTVTWNSQALAERTSDFQATTFENIDVSAFLNSGTAGHLTATGNVLAIQVMKSSLAEGDLLVVPELSQIVTAQLGNHFFATPTPGTANTIDTWQPDIAFSVQRGFFYDPFQLTITTTTTGADVYYTLDGSAPSSAHGTRYTAPITIGTTATVRAVSTVAGGSAGVVSTETYVFPNDVINQPANPAGYPTTWGSERGDYGMDTRITTDPAYANELVQDLLSLPTMSIVTDQSNLFDPSTGIYANAMNSDMEVPTSFEYFDPATGQTFQINAALRMQGGVGRYAGFEKHSFRLVFKAPYGPSKLNFPLFGDDATDSFDTITLRANFNDAWVWGQNQAQFIRDQFADQTLLAMGEPASHGTYVQLYVNGMYWGLYNPTERPDTSFAATYLGGDKENWDGLNSDTPVNSSDLTEYYALANFNFQNGSTAAYQMVQGNNPDGTRNPTYPVLLDMNNYVDYMLMNYYIGNTDWPGHNWYAGRPEDSSPTTLDSTGFKCFPWDSEMATGLQWAYDPNTNVIGGGSGWMATTFNALRNNADFRTLFADHAQKFLFNGGPMTTAVAQARYRALADEIQQAVTTESARWGDVSGTLYKPSDWLADRDYTLNTWLGQRTNIFIQQLRNAGLYPAVDAASFRINGSTQFGGLFTPGDSLTITASASPIYYTLDGSDPRLPGGGLNPAAVLYTGPITLTQGVEVKARVYVNGTWSALSEAGFYVNLAPSIRITELMYHPSPATADEIARGYTGNDANDFEYVEIKNIGTTTLPLAGLRFDNGITFTFPNFSLAPNQYVLVVANQTAFHIRYPGVSTSLIAGQYSGHLDSAGEEIELDAPSGGIVQDFTYTDNWYGQTDGDGFSLTVRDPLQAASLWDSADGWRASSAPNGSPGGGETNPIPNPGSVIINEVLAHPSTPGGDMVELYNTTGLPLNIGGWFLSDSSTNLAKYQIAANTIIAAGGYLVLTDARNYGSGSGDPGAHVAFALPVLGGDVYLSSNYSGVPGGYREHVNIDYAPAGVSQGLFTKSTGATDFPLLQTPTFGAAPTYAGAANSVPYVAPVVLNEVMYHPATPTAAEEAAGFTNEDDFEFLELYNRSGSPQTLRNLEIGDGIGFTFGWYPDGMSNEVQTLESGATATWSTTGLASAAYTVYAHYTLVDGNGNRRTALDEAARYTITYAGGSATVTVNQNQIGATGNDIWVNLGVYSFNGPASVTLTRGDTDPSDWTLADSVKFTAAGHSDVIVANPALHSFATDSGMTTLAPGGYVVLVGNYQAFDARYHVAANHIPVAGVYSGDMSNGGEMVRLYQVGDSYPAYVASYQIDHLDYSDKAPWVTSPDGNGPALIRVHTADYGNDPINWRASNAGGTPGAANVVVDDSTPAVPVGLVGVVTLNPAAITLTWTPVAGGRSGISHYAVYRDGAKVGISTTASYTDANAQVNSNYTYQISAVNSDGYESGKSAAITAGVPGVVSSYCPDNRHVEITFSERLNPTTASVLGNYGLSGGSFTGVALSRSNTIVTLTTNSAITVGAGYTVTMNNLTTVSGDPLPANQQFSFTYTPQGTGSILREYWSNIGYGDAVSDLTSNPNYPNNPSGKDLLTSFEAPSSWGDAYGTRIRGYLSPPVSGYYTFWIASDDNGELWLSTNDNPANKVRIAYVTSWTGSREWNNSSNPTQQSASIYLEAGKRYYVEALQKEGDGGDNLAVRWQLPGGTWENGDSTLPIPGIRLSPYAMVDATPPTVPANVRATVSSNNQVNLVWSPAADSDSGVDHYVIYRDGQLCGTSPIAAFTDSNVGAQILHSYQVSAVNYDGAESFRSLTVNTVMGGIYSVTAASATAVQIVFTEPVNSVSAQTVGNYQIGGIAVSSAHLEADNRTVTLTTSLLSGGVNYTLTASNVRTSLGVTLPTQSMSFAIGGTLDYDYWLNIGGGTAVSDLTSNPNYPNNPSGHQSLASFDAPINWADSYGSRIRGYIIAPQNGYYIFWIASDGSSELWLSTDSDPAHKAKIASVPGSTGHNVWNVYPQQHSIMIHLWGGQQYYIEALQKEGSGADNLSVGWQLPRTDFNPNMLPIPAQYLVPYDTVSPTLTIGINTLVTEDATPAITGTVSEATATIAVRVAGTYYTANNNGDGTWTLPKGQIVTPLSAGTYDVTATAIDAPGYLAFDATINELVIDATTPTATIAAVNPNPRLGSVGSIAIQFSEPVAGFDLQDLQFTRDNVSLPLNGATLTTSDHKNWTLGNLSDLTSPIGNYRLALVEAGSSIVSIAGIELATDAITTWRTVAPLPGDFNLDGAVDNLDLNIWFRYAGIGTTLAQGDGNGDGVVNGLDLDLWLANRGKSIYSGAPSASGPAVGSPAGSDPSTNSPSTEKNSQPPTLPGKPLAPVAPPIAKLGGSNVVPPAQIVSSAPAVSMSAPTAASPIGSHGSDPMVLLAASATCLGTGQQVHSNSQPPLAAGIDSLTMGQGQTTAVSTPKTASSLSSTNKSDTPAAAVQTAHDAVFSQLEVVRPSVVDDLLGGGKTDPYGGLVAAKLVPAGLVASGTSLLPPSGSSKNTTK
jgi:hypothetical protein